VIKSLKYNFFLIIFCVALYSCGNQKKLAFKQNQASVYQPNVTIVRPEFNIYHQSDSISQLLIKIELSDLLFNYANPENKLLANIQVRIKLFDITENPLNKVLCDSSLSSKIIEKIPGKQFVILNTNIKAKYTKNYKLEINVYDLIRDAGNTNYLFINKQNKNSQQNFKVYSANNNATYFKNYVNIGDSIKIQVNQQIKKLYISYQKEKLILPPPPFSSLIEPEFLFQPDSNWIMPYNINTTYIFPYTGLYLIRTDTSTNEGLYLANFGNSFPAVNTIENMVYPVEYLSTTEEFRKIINNENKKSAIDSFWLQFSGNLEVCKELIRIYYNRLQYANYYFTSYKPGWKTDRGMIYMIFGSPSYIKKTDTQEIWEYYIKQDATNLKIYFNRTPSPYSNNHFIMKRDNTFTSFWREAVKSWRTGTPYSLEEL
jgi:GWxTD domain-containing protein